MSESEAELLWTPSPERVERATITRYQRWLAESSRGLTFEDYDALWRWSVDDLPAFWCSIAEFFEVRFDSEPSAVLGSETMPGRRVVSRRDVELRRARLPRQGR